MITTTVQCDACPASTVVAAVSLDHARDIAVSNHWRCDGSWDLCPEHAALTDEEVRVLCPF